MFPRTGVSDILTQHFKKTPVLAGGLVFDKNRCIGCLTQHFKKHRFLRVGLCFPEQVYRPSNSTPGEDNECISRLH